ncbi:hypothetical protein QNI19_14485 [Cytophagaceae bacterium DM2B3-1]|uniref:IPExxxVDY family protein n=1 Tax=Xanthocytophaga flava TaxID=3048013 RepID=A0ABT7CK69_9BACT|nr:hypothetical protein [Xanthocytophaga flavus]MDJ1494148.1 hypothetical protein [Xanthocytophaga flavus]
MKIVQIDIQKFILRLLPVDLQKPGNYAYIRAFLQPFVTIHAAFLAYRIDSNGRAKLNGQTQILENLLNRTFPSATNLIKIVNSSLRLDAVYLFNEPELQPEVFVSNIAEGDDELYLVKSTEGTNLYDFIVQVPAAMSALERSQIRSIVSKYKIATKTFEIQII